MSTTDTTATQDRPPRRVKAATPPTLDPARLEFDHEVTYLRDDRLVLTATYPSEHEAGARHTIHLRSDGSVVSCDCKGATFAGKCFHRDAADEIVREYWRRDFAAWEAAKLVAEDNWLAAWPPHTDAERLRLDALGDVIGERYVTRYGVAVRQEGAA